MAKNESDTHSPWTQRDNFSARRHQALQDAVNRSENFFSGDGEVITGPFGRSLTVSSRRARRTVVARITGTTIDRVPAGTGTATMGGGYYVGRLQRDTGHAIDPTATLDLSQLFEDVTGVDDCYVEDMPENLVGGSHTITTDGNTYVIGYYVDYSDGANAPALPVLRMTGAGGAALGTGQYQYQAFMMVAQNQNGWDFYRGHPLI